MFTRCKICGLNYITTQEHKHNLQKYHLDKLNRCLHRFTQKKYKCVNDIKKLELLAKEHPPLNIWCYFCSRDILYNEVYERFQILAYGFFSHLSSLRHVRNVSTAFSKNNLKDNHMEYCIEKRHIEKLNEPIEVLKKSCQVANKNFSIQSYVNTVNPFQKYNQDNLQNIPNTNRLKDNAHTKTPSPTPIISNKHKRMESNDTFENVQPLRPYVSKRSKK